MHFIKINCCVSKDDTGTGILNTLSYFTFFRSRLQIPLVSKQHQNTSKFLPQINGNGRHQCSASLINYGQITPSADDSHFTKRNKVSHQLDEIVYKFFHDAYNSNAFNNTVVFFFSDHGLRYGAIRSSDIGSYEVQSPVMFIAFPTWFSEKYPTIMKNLKSNTRKLTTMYDVHETLRNILNFSGSVIEYSSPERGESLFSDVSNTRNCSDVGVPDSMCTCSLYRKVVN